MPSTQKCDYVKGINLAMLRTKKRNCRTVALPLLVPNVGIHINCLAHLISLARKITDNFPIIAQSAIPTRYQDLSLAPIARKKKTKLN